MRHVCCALCHSMPLHAPCCAARACVVLHLMQVIEQLQQVDADIISLQEVDIGCDRSGFRDTGSLIAQALQLHYIFICEFEELHSELRDARSQGGGVHGNAILTKFDIIGWDIIEHSHHPINWNAAPEQQPHPLAAREPRRGRCAVSWCQWCWCCRPACYKSCLLQ